MTIEEIYKLKTELEAKAFQVWQTPVEASQDIDNDKNILVFCLKDYCILYYLEAHMCNVAYTTTFESVQKWLDFIDFDFALAICLGLQQALNNEKQVLTNTKGYLLELTCPIWNQNRKLYIELPKHRSCNTAAILTITRPLDSDDGKSSALAYPLDADSLKAIVECFRGILEND